jgi:hypothetical protein
MLTAHETSEFFNIQTEDIIYINNINNYFLSDYN